MNVTSLPAWAIELEIENSAIRAVVLEVWQSMAGIDLDFSEIPVPLRKSTGYAVASVQMLGEATCIVRLELELSLLRDTASKILMVEAAVLTSAEIEDAAGELANVVGGSLRRGWNPDSRLSLPAVVFGTDFVFLAHHGVVSQRCSFSAPSGNVNVFVEQPRTRPGGRPAAETAIQGHQESSGRR